MNEDLVIDLVTGGLIIFFVALGLLTVALEVFDSLDYKDDQK